MLLVDCARSARGGSDLQLRCRSGRVNSSAVACERSGSHRGNQIARDTFDVIILYPLVVGAAFVVLLRRRDRTGGRGWRWFGVWGAAGMLLTFSFLTGFSIGLLVLPLAAAALVFVASRAPHFAESIGFLGGVGGVALLVALGNRDSKPCGEQGQVSIPAGAPPGTSVSCGGLDPEPWLNTGVVTSGLAVAAYAVLRWRLRRDAEQGAEAEAI